MFFTYFKGAVNPNFEFFHPKIKYIFCFCGDKEIESSRQVLLRKNKVLNKNMCRKKRLSSCCSDVMNRPLFLFEKTYLISLYY